MEKEGFNIIPMDTMEKRMKGLQHMKPILDKTIWVFQNTHEGLMFHSRNVMEPFDIVFLDHAGLVLEAATVVPQDGTITAPKGAVLALESKEGVLTDMGMDVGRKINLNALLGKKEE